MTQAPDPRAALLVQAARDRFDLKADVESYMKFTNGAWMKLKQMHEKRQWRHDYSTFEEFCSSVLGLTRRRAYQMIEAETAQQAMLADFPEETETVEALNERQVKGVASLPKPQRVAVLRKITAETQATGKTVRKVAPKIIKAATVIDITPQPKLCPHCNKELP